MNNSSKSQEIYYHFVQKILCHYSSVKILVNYIDKVINNFSKQIEQQRNDILSFNTKMFMTTIYLSI